jgi:cytochrome c oxidase subunit 2
VSRASFGAEEGENRDVIRIPIRTAAGVLLGGVVMFAAALVWRSGLLEGLVAGTAPLRVTVIGHNWWWEFVYPELGIKTANELHLPESRGVQLELTSVDVLHTLSIPELGVLADALPGATSQISLPSVESGEYGGECSEICGTAHNMMRVKVVVHTASDFETWAVRQQEPAAVPQSEQQWRGYEMLTTACAKCHSLNPAESRTDLLGPNLAHLMSRSVFAGATFELNETNLRRWLRDTQAMKSGNDMVVKLPRDDYEAVVEYLLMLE